MPFNTWIKPMTVTRRMTFALATGLLAALAGSAAFSADTTINVSLWDKGADSAMMDEMHKFGITDAAKADMSMAMMGIKLDQATVPAGMVTFAVTNDSKDIIHEMVVAPLTSMNVEPPYNADENKIDEDAAGHLGEVAELNPGQTGSLGIDLKPGQYLLYCNIPGHYIGGMWTVLTVTE